MNSSVSHLPYKDQQLDATARTADLLARMTIEEKVGQMLHGTAPGDTGPLARIGVGNAYDLDGIADIVANRGITSMICRLNLSPKALAEQNNRAQEIAAQTRLGIPISFSTDPRHHLGATFGAGVDAVYFSQFPGTLGLAASRDTDLVRQFGEVMRAEYRAVGFHIALSPQADLATEARWPRTDGTFGTDPQLVRRMVGAFVQGVQGGTDGLHANSVAAVVKHWVGYGASRDGFDGHCYYGRYSAFPGGHFQAHVDAFLDAFAFNVAGVMPSYTIMEGLVIDGKPVEQVGAGYVGELLNGLLRTTCAYKGLVLSDWGITRNSSVENRTGVPAQGPQHISMAWGVEDLALPERFAKGVNAGIDQYGGDDDPKPLLEAIERGLISLQRVDEAVSRVLLQKFELGLFDNPFVDADAANEIVGTEANRNLGLSAQRKSVTILSGSQHAIGPDDVVYETGISRDAFANAGITTTDSLSNATHAVIKVRSPSQLLHPTFFFGSRQPEGDLDFKADNADLAHIASAAASVPTTVVLQLDRATIIGALQPHAESVVGVFGISDEVLVDALTTPHATSGKLPIHLPQSMEEVLNADCDAPKTVN